MPLPTFVIPGAQKCGTSSLAATLRRHPEVFVSGTKELHYFDRDDREGLDTYAEHFTPTSQQQTWGEATPAYLYDAEARRRMCESLPEARLIVILRDPVKRAYSHYWHSRRISMEKLEFEAAIDAEPERLARGNPQAWRHKSYVDRGHYIEQIEALTALHDPALVHVMLFEDLIDDRVPALRKVFEFLGVDPAPAETIEEQWKNPAQVKQDDGTKVRATYPSMDPDMRKRLVEHFRPYNDRLAEWLGRDLSAWNEV